MAFLSVHVVAFVALASLVAAQGNSPPVAPPNPFQNLIYTSGGPKILPLLNKLAADVKYIRATHETFLPVTSATATTVTTPQAAFTEALSMIQQAANISFNQIEPMAQNISVLLRQVQTYHLFKFSNLTASYDNALNALSALNNTMNQDENNVISDIHLLTEKLPSFTANFAEAEAKAKATLANLLTVHPLNGGFLASKGNALTNLLTTMNTTIRALHTASREHAVRTSKNITATINDTFNDLFRNINYTRNTYVALTQNLTSYGIPQMTRFNGTFNNTCLSNELILQQTKDIIAQFQQYIDKSKPANLAALDNSANQAKDKLVREHQKAIANAEGLLSEVQARLAKQGIFALDNAAVAAFKPKIEQLLNKALDFLDKETTAVQAANTDFAGLGNLGDLNSLVGRMTEVMGNMALVVAGAGNADHRVLTVNNTGFTILKSDVPLEYPLSFSDPFPENPKVTSLYNGGLKETDFSSYTQGAISYSAPTQKSCNYVCPNAPAPGTVPSTWFPNPFTPYPCLDSTITSAYDVSQVPSIPGNWIKFSIDMTSYSLKDPAAAFIHVFPQSKPDAPAILSMPKNFDTATPTVPVIVNGQYTFNGWNNFILSWRVKSTQALIEVFILVTDIASAIKAGLTARVAFVAQ